MKMVLAGGGIITNQKGKILLIHRPHYDDWSFPKGKIDKGETIESCALREVWEETGYQCELGLSLGKVGYVDRKGRDKEVHYWRMQIVSGEFTANDEVDEITWVDVKEAFKLLTYERDKDLLLRFAGKKRKKLIAATR